MPGTRALAHISLAVFAAVSLRADIRLPAIFSDHMVLEKSARVPIWGKADPGEEIHISLAGQSVRTTTAPDGRWRAELDLQNSASGPFEMTVSGRNSLTISDVVVGEVWLASGQSNMQWPLEKTDAREEIAQSVNPMLRQFRVERSARPEPAEDCAGSWTVAGPETSGAFSAIGYYFGKTLQSELNAPVGIIQTIWGGSPVESWISRAAIDSMPDLKSSRDDFLALQANAPARKAAFVTAYKKWLVENHREDRPPADPAVYAAESLSPAGWEKVQLPGTPFAATGAIWLRKEFEVPASLAGKKTWLNLGAMEGFESVYLNGRFVSRTTPETLAGSGTARVASVPEDILRTGKNVLALRVFSPLIPPRFPAIPRLGPLELGASWLAKSEFAWPDLPPAQAATAPPIPPGAPSLLEIASSLYNGMIHPIVPYAMRGVIWYQGESNIDRAWQYHTTFPLLIKDWRTAWQRDDLPFYFCQLANYLPKEQQPGESAWAELREAQSRTLRIPKTGQAVLIDLGESLSLHPRNKKDVSDRLARIVLAKEYGKNIPFSGPVYRSFAVEGGKVRLHFTRADGGLIARPLPATYDTDSLSGETATLVRNSPRSELEGFAICGQDRKWVWADARIEGDTVLVWSDQVPAPVAVRYAWANNPTCNLYNGAGLPASPFRTDDFPALTKDARY